MRGKESNGKPSELVSRITPACAGKRYMLYFSHDFAWDHPRMCGEKPLGLAPAGWPSGSPPHVRGKGCDACTRSVYDGITPACAGKSKAGRLFKIMAWDHPRMCGEKVIISSIVAVIQGSPPHVRGKGLHILAHGLDVGITPACAGKRQGQVVPGFAFEDHPRMCGEKSATYSPFSHKIGSPPHVRGKVPPHCCFCPALGITPACAGKRFPTAALFRSSRDHPRVCGEKEKPRRGYPLHEGSPPRMRGKD